MNKLFRMLLLLLFVVGAIACQRQLIEDENNFLVRIPITIDWSLSNVPTADINAVSVYFFPKDGGEPLVYVSNNIQSMKVDVPVGEYSILIFNETVAQGDWKGITFTGTDKYSTFMASYRENTKSKGNVLYTKADDEKVILEPDPLAAWSLDYYKVTPEMYARIHTNSTKSLSAEDTKTADESLAQLQNIKPLPRISVTNVTAKVTNLNSAYLMTGTLKGLAGGVYLASGETVQVPVTQLFTFQPQNYQWDDNSHINGNAVNTFNVFGKVPDKTATYGLQIDVVPQSGDVPPPYQFDVTSQVNASANNVITIHVELSLEPSQSEGVSVDDWIKVNQNIE